MKATFLTFFLLILLLNSVGQTFDAGLSMGITTSQYDGDSYSGYNKLGISAGGFVRTSINEKLAFQFEIIYIEKGAKRNPKPDKNYFNQYAVKLNYMEIPLLLKYTYKNIVFESGISFGALVKSYEEAQYIDITGFRPFNKTETSFNLGLNYPFSDRLEINCRYSYSILPVRSFPAGTTYFLRLGETNNVIAFTLKYSLGGKSNGVSKDAN